ncbi:HsdM family class I SAM-dependent methyltransferase [Pseudomonas viridiflava]|uniref:HsdM family class I SAM-dependent methyltransferase n=1 Tax=Pseudomonas viridiflava TaxID=33069 RepID=UPI0013CEB95D|nr:N-6 DNA methylase [Pseudomonas viridiflava]
MLVEETLQLEEICALAHEERRRSLGAFYTPSFLSKLLCVWAIQDQKQIVLEPSFGGCTFLEEIASRFNELGSFDPLRGVYGCDIDSNAFLKLETLDIGGYANNFIQQDFLRLSHESFCVGKADVVIGNPPYIGHSQIGSEQRKAIEAWRETCEFSLDAKSSLWVYFLIHSLSFLKEGGRLAFVLPGSFLSADYSKKIHKLLSEKFGQCLVVSLAERIFVSEGAEERTVILFAEGYKESGQCGGVVKAAHATILSSLPALIAEWDRDSSTFYDFSDIGVGSFLDRSIVDKFLKLNDQLSGVALGDIAKVNIGIVTGDTKYFIKSLLDWRELGVAKSYLKFVVPKIRGISGIYLTKAQVSTLLASDSRCLLLDTEQESLSPEVILYLSQYPEEKKNLATYKKRSIWHQPDDHKIPDGFLTFLTHNGPRLVLNDAKVNCTNSVHRLFFRKKPKGVDAKLIALSMLSTFTQVHAEIIGRPCGSGALKLEPKDALQLKLLIPKSVDFDLVKTAFRCANKALSRNPPDEEGARKIADDAIVAMIDVDFQDDLEELGRALHIAREYRKGNVELKLE